MAAPGTRLILITPLLAEPEAFAPALAAALAAGGVAAAIVRFAATDERSLARRAKALAPAVQEAGAAFILAAEGDADLVQGAARSGADGIHVAGWVGDLRDLKERLKGERSLGVGALRSRDDAMACGEAGADYLLFGEPRPDGSLPAWPAVLERTAWWAEIFETPCIVYAPSLDALAEAAATRAEFVALGDAVFAHPGGPAAAVRAAGGALAAMAAEARP